jgi:hypothetical protein
VQKTLTTSNFKKLYSDDESGALRPKHINQIFGSLQDFLLAYVQQNGLSRTAAEEFFNRLQLEAMQGAVVEDELDDVGRLAQRIWSSDQSLQEVPNEYRLEFCSILNSAIRSDDKTLLEAIMPMIRAVNSLCIVRGVRSDTFLRFPPTHKCFRGSGMPKNMLSFFSPGVKYRVPGFLATSFFQKVS